MKYKLYDEVYIKPQSWFDAIRGDNLEIKGTDGYIFSIGMANFCSKLVTIKLVSNKCYVTSAGNFPIRDWMIDQFSTDKRMHAISNGLDFEYDLEKAQNANIPKKKEEETSKEENNDESALKYQDLVHTASHDLYPDYVEIMINKAESDGSKDIQMKLVDDGYGGISKNNFGITGHVDYGKKEIALRATSKNGELYSIISVTCNPKFNKDGSLRKKSGRKVVPAHAPTNISTKSAIEKGTLVFGFDDNATYIGFYEKSVKDGYLVKLKTGLPVHLKKIYVYSEENFLKVMTKMADEILINRDFEEMKNKVNTLVNNFNKKHNTNYKLKFENENSKS